MTVLDINQSHHHVHYELGIMKGTWGSQPLVSIKSLGTTLIEIQYFEHGERRSVVQLKYATDYRNSHFFHLVCFRQKKYFA